MDPDRVLEAARRALEAGEDPQAVDAAIASRTHGLFTSFNQLDRAVRERRATEADPEAAALQRLNARGGSAAGDFLRMAAQGATLGFADELAGLGAAIAPGGRGYRDARDASRQRVEDLRTLNPGASTLSEIAGGFALPFGGGRALGRGVTSRTGSRAAGAMAGGAGAGAAGSAAYGAGEADGDLAERGKGALSHGLFGSILGMLTGGATAAAGRLVERARSAVGGPRGGGTEASKLSARRALKRALDEAEVPQDEIPERLAEIGPDAVVADLGANLGREARAAANQSPTLAGPGGPIPELERRAANRGERIAVGLRTASGIERTFRESLEAADAHVQAVRKKFFRPLEEAHPHVTGKTVEKALERPEVAAAAVRVAPEAVAGTRPPTFRELQDIMMELRDDMTAARASGRPNRSRKAFEAFEVLREAMEEDIPGFREAQNAWRVAQKRIEAHELGRKAISAARPAREILDELAELPPEAREAYRHGILDAFEVKLRQRESGSGTATGLMAAGQEVQDKLRVLAESDAAFRQLLQDLDREVLYSRTWNALAGNSTTTQQQHDAAAQFVQVPTSKQAVFRRLLSIVAGLGPAEKRNAAEVLGRALMGKGEEAAELLAYEMALSSGLSGGIGAGAGTAAAIGSPSLFE